MIFDLSKILFHRIGLAELEKSTIQIVGTTGKEWECCLKTHPERIVKSVVGEVSIEF